MHVTMSYTFTTHGIKIKWKGFVWFQPNIKVSINGGSIEEQNSTFYIEVGACTG